MQDRDHLNVFMPGFDGCFADPFQGGMARPSPAAWGRLGRSARRGSRGSNGPCATPAFGSRAARSTGSRPGPNAHRPLGDASIHQRIAMALEDDRQRKIQEIAVLESDLAELLARTPYILLLSVPGVNVASAAEFAGEMGPIGNYASSRSITRRAGWSPRAVEAIGWTARTARSCASPTAASARRSSRSPTTS